MTLRSINDRNVRSLSLAIDASFHICSHAVMFRVADDNLSTHLEVALATAAPSLLDGRADCDQRRRHAAVGEIARWLVERLRCFEITSEDDNGRIAEQPCLFPHEERCLDNLDN